MKYRVLRDMTYGGRPLSAGDAVSHTFLVEHGNAAKPDVLLRTRYIEPGADLARMSKDELFEYADRLGLGPSRSDRKAELRESIETFLAEADQVRPVAA